MGKKSQSWSKFEKLVADREEKLREAQDKLKDAKEKRKALDANSEEATAGQSENQANTSRMGKTKATSKGRVIKKIFKNRK